MCIQLVSQHSFLFPHFFTPQWNSAIILRKNPKSAQSRSAKPASFCSSSPLQQRWASGWGGGGMWCAGTEASRWLSVSFFGKPAWFTWHHQCHNNTVYFQSVFLRVFFYPRSRGFKGVLSKNWDPRQVQSWKREGNIYIRDKFRLVPSSFPPVDVPVGARPHPAPHIPLQIPHLITPSLHRVCTSEYHQ